MTWLRALAMLAIAIFFLPAANAQSISNGNTLYHSLCVACHGDPPAGGPEFATSAAYIRNALNTIPSMMPFRNQFTDAQLEDIYAYLVSLRGPPPVTANTPGPLSGLFYNAQESGWGVHFTQRGSNVFAAWYTYDAAGNPKWYVATCAMAGGATGTTGSCSGQLFQVTGPHFFGVPFNASLVNATAAGTLQVTWSSANAASMTYTAVAGQTRTVAIVRQPLATGSVPDVDYTDIWWGGSSESGWGIAITQQASTIFVAWYVYDNNGNPTWYVGLCTLSGTTCVGDALATHGPPFGPTFNPTLVTVLPSVGTIALNFTDANNGVLNYTINGVPGSKLITRQLF